MLSTSSGTVYDEAVTGVLLQLRLEEGGHCPRRAERLLLDVYV